MQLTIDTSKPLDPQEVKILRLVLRAAQETPSETPSETLPESATPENTLEAPEVKEQPTEAPEQVSEDQQAPAEEQEISNETLEAAVSAAKLLIQDGKKKKVADALKSLGLTRVSSIETEGDGLKFIEALGN